MELIDRFRLEEDENWRDWIQKIPFITFPDDWQIQIIPPFASAMARFRVKKGDDYISVYLDVYENLGYFGGEPYWEIYPYDDDTYRVAMNDTDELIKRISEALEQK